jgi:hypothetical protein
MFNIQKAVKLPLGREIEVVQNRDNTITAFFLSAGTIPEPIIETYLLGDVNGDGVINESDYAVLSRYIAGDNVAIDIRAADIDQDGQITTSDLTLLELYIIGYMMDIYPAIGDEMEYEVVPEIDEQMYMLANRTAIVNRGDYTGLEWRIEPPKFTLNPVSSFGTKQKIGLGGYGFFIDLAETETSVRIPIVPRNSLEEVNNGIISVSSVRNVITYVIEDTRLIFYNHFRLVFSRTGELDRHFILNSTQGNIPKPPNWRGTFAVRLQGFNEMQDYSAWFNVGFVYLG